MRWSTRTGRRSPMSLESYYTPTKDAQRLALAQVAEKLADAGLPCRIEPEAENMFWLAFEPHESDILASVEDGVVVFGTFHLNGDDPSSVPETVERVMQSIGFSADEDAEY